VKSDSINENSADGRMTSGIAGTADDDYTGVDEDEVWEEGDNIVCNYCL